MSLTYSAVGNEIRRVAWAQWCVGWRRVEIDACWMRALGFMGVDNARRLLKADLNTALALRGVAWFAGKA